MSRAVISTPTGARGFTLIELLVGLVIGLITTAVIAQVMVVSEGRRRTTVSGSDAQVSGAVALYAIRRQVEMAGYGVTVATSALGCNLVKARHNGLDRNFTLSPLVITNGASDAPDTITLLGSAKRSYSLPVRITQDHNQADTTFFVTSSLGTEVGDLMIAVPKTIDANNWCSVFNVSSLPGSTQIVHTPGTSDLWNEAGNPIFPAKYSASPSANAFLINLGQSATQTISVVPGVGLRFDTFNSSSLLSATDDMFPDVVQMQAFYAKATIADDVVDTFDTVTPTTEAGWRQVKGVRLAIVARSAQMEKDAVTTAEPQWDVGSTISMSGALACGNSKCIPIVVGAAVAGSDAQRYRYKVFDSYIPLRNLLWRG